jgi:hypothetical protein
MASAQNHFSSCIQGTLCMLLKTCTARDSVSHLLSDLMATQTILIDTDMRLLSAEPTSLNLFHDASLVVDCESGNAPAITPEVHRVTALFSLNRPRLLSFPTINHYQMTGSEDPSATYELDKHDRHGLMFQSCAWSLKSIARRYIYIPYVWSGRIDSYGTSSS